MNRYLCPACEHEGHPYQVGGMVEAESAMCENPYCRVQAFDLYWE